MKRSGWDPLKELAAVQARMNQLFDSAIARTNFDTGSEVDSWSPVADVFETPEQLVLAVELPGLSLEDINLRVEGDELVVEGERKMERGGDDERFHRVERAYGRFSRRFPLPASVDRDSIQATYRDGVLRVTLERKQKRDAGRIPVSIG